MAEGDSLSDMQMAIAQLCDVLGGQQAALVNNIEGLRETISHQQQILDRTATAIEAILQQGAQSAPPQHAPPPGQAWGPPATPHPGHQPPPHHGQAQGPPFAGPPQAAPHGPPQQGDGGRAPKTLEEQLGRLERTLTDFMPTPEVGYQSDPDRVLGWAPPVAKNKFPGKTLWQLCQDPEGIGYLCWCIGRSAKEFGTHWRQWNHKYARSDVGILWALANHTPRGQQQQQGQQQAPQAPASSWGQPQEAPQGNLVPPPPQVPESYGGGGSDLPF